MQFRRKSEMVTPDQALPGRAEPPEPVPATHVVLARRLQQPDAANNGGTSLQDKGIHLQVAWKF